MNGYRVGKELVLVFVDLSDHFPVGLVGVREMPDRSAVSESGHLLPDGLEIRFARVLEPGLFAKRRGWTRVDIVTCCSI